MAKRLKLFGGTLLAVIAILALLWQALPYWLPWLVNRMLPAGTVMSLSGSPHWRDQGLGLPDVRLAVQGCTLLDAMNPHIRYRQQRWELQLQRFELDSACLARLPASQDDDAAAISLADWQQRLPNMQVAVAQLIVTPWQYYAGRAELIAENGGQRLHYAGANLSFDAALDGKLRLNLQRLSLQLPDSPQPLRLSGTLTLPSSLDDLPSDGALRGELQTGYAPLPLELSLSWQQRQGELTIAEKGERQPLARLPWSIDAGQIQVAEGQWRWPYAQQPLSGGISLALQNWSDGWDETEFSARLNVITTGQTGKANAVLTLGPGRIGLINSDLGFQLSGRANLSDISFTATLPGLLGGSIINPSITLKPGAILRAYGNVMPQLKLDEVRWPLAGVSVSAAGVSGRLQAILRASDSYWGRFQLHLDGRAKDFWPDSGNWRWQYWGGGELPPLQARWDVTGKGYWQDNVIAVEQLSTGFDRLRYGLVTVESPRLVLNRPLLWRRAADMGSFSGALILQADKTRFSNGGYLPQSQLSVQLQGPDINHFTLNGELQAESIGPIRLNGRWDGERLRGEGWWPKQSLTVFQPLLSPDLKIKLRDGEFYAQSAFSAARKQGFEAGGHWVVRNGGMWLSDGEVSGLDFVLSYRLHNQTWQLGPQQPVMLRIKSLRNLFDMQNISADLQGFYPYSDAQPLTLSNVGVDLLQGHLALSELSLPQRQPTLLTLRQIDLSELFYVLKPKQFAMSGKVNGELPLYLYDPQWLIKGGWLENSGPLTLRMDRDMLEAITEDNIVAGTALDWFSYLEISRSRADVSLDNLGMLQMLAEIHGVNSQISEQREVKLNYQHQENIFQLWRSLRFGDNLQEWLEQTISLPTRTTQ